MRCYTNQHLPLLHSYITAHVWLMWIGLYKWHFILLLIRAVPERLDRHVNSICLLNVVIKQGILINTHKTKQATCCRVICNRVPFITHYCVFIQVMTQHWQFENYLQKKTNVLRTSASRRRHLQLWVKT